MPAARDPRPSGDGSSYRRDVGLVVAQPSVPSEHLSPGMLSLRAPVLSLLFVACAPVPVPTTPSSDGAVASDDAAPATDATAPDVPVLAADAPQAPDGTNVSPDVPSTPDVVTAPDLPAPSDVLASPDAGAPRDVPLVMDVPASRDVVATDVPVTVDAGTPTDVPAPPADVGVPSGPPGALLDALVGTWATRTRAVTEQSVPVLGNVRTVSNAFGIAVFARRGEAFTLTERACRVSFERSALGQTSLEDRAVQAIAPLTAPITFARVGDAWRWSRAARAVAVGWMPRTSPDEAIPTARTDPRVVDTDGDGNPGISVRIASVLANGTVYVVQTQRSALAGGWAMTIPVAINDPTGSVQRTVGASSPLLAQDIPSRVDATPGNNGVTFARVAAETDCAGVIRQLDSLFR